MSSSLHRIGALLLAGGAAFAFAQGAAAQGDGAATDNPALLRGAYPAFCVPSMLCHYGQAAASPPPRAILAHPQAVSAPPPTAPDLPVSAPPPALYDPAPYPTSFEPAWDADLGLTLRGSIVASETATRYEAHVVPRAALRYRGAGTAIEIAATADLARPTDGPLRLDAAGLDLSLRQAVGPTSLLTLDVALDVSQGDPRDLDVPAGAMTAPLVFAGSADAGFVQSFGRAQAALRAGIARESFEDPARAEDNRTSYSGGLRLSYALSPILGIFTDGSLGRDEFDTAAPALGASRSGWTYGLRGGVTANWRDVLTLETSAGWGWRDFDAAGLSGMRSLLYGVALGFNPDPARRLALRYDTAIAPGSHGSAASIDHTLALEAGLRVTERLGLRGSASAAWIVFADAAGIARRFDIGMGADIALGPRTGLTLDYLYGWRDDPRLAPAPRDEHRLSAGLTMRY